MSIVELILLAFGVGGLTIGIVCTRQLRRWEHQLRGVRVVIAFKGRSKMTPRLIDWLRWGNSLDSDRSTNGQVIYKMGGTTIAILKPPPKEHGKTTTRTIKEDNARS